MITWSGFIAKLVEFIATKLVGKSLDITLDKKKKACKSFLRFYEAVVELEKRFGIFVVFVEKLVQQRNTKIYGSHMRSIVADLPKLSDEFIASLEDLIGVLKVLDPPLAYLLSHVRVAKSAIIARASSIFTNEVMPFDIKQRSEEGPGSMYFTVPTETLLNAGTIEQFYEELQSEQYRTALAFPGPSIDILRSRLKLMSTEVLVYADEIIKLVPLLSTFKEHQRLLATAREKLRAFIEQRFSLEDLLYAETHL